ncbi:MAG: LysM peptidoglycan-binding domain-containing protein, partial [Desulfovibrio sp.]|nr:LysM peptidoglycan-binding domain-containing protein [Desulfovibrio sp.]
GVIAYPDLTVEEFRIYDKDAGGALSGEEYDVFVAARKSGQPPTSQAKAEPAAPPAQPAQAEIPAAPTPPPSTPPAGDAPAPPSVSQQGPQTAAPASTQPPAASVQETAPAQQALPHVEVSSTSSAPEPEKTPAAPVAYTVQPGDTLNKIARKFGVSAKDIIAANRIDNPDRVEAGKVLEIPQGGGSSGTAREAAPEIQAFVADFFARSGAENADSLLELYADEVDFYKKGLVSKDFVREDKTKYFQRWPTREYTVSGKPKVTDVPGAKRRRIEVPVRYKAKNAEKTASGEAVFVFEVVSDGGSPRIVLETSGAAVKK